MKIRVSIGIIIVSFNLNVFAEPKKAGVDTLPFINHKARIIYYSAPIQSTGLSTQMELKSIQNSDKTAIPSLCAIAVTVRSSTLNAFN